MEHIRPFLPYAVGIAILWVGLDYTTSVYEAYETVCSKSIYSGCKGIYNEIVTLRFMVALCAITSGYAFSRYLAWAKKDREQHRQANL